MQYENITNITVQYQYNENLLVSLISINCYTQEFRKFKSKVRIFTTTTTKGSGYLKSANLYHSPCRALWNPIDEKNKG